MHYLVNIGCNCQQNRTCTIPCAPEDVHMIAGAMNEITPEDLTDALLKYGLITQDSQNKVEGTARVKYFEEMNGGIVKKFGNSHAGKPIPSHSDSNLRKEREREREEALPEDTPF